MIKGDLQKKILKLLKHSTIPYHDKKMVEILMPVMEIENLRAIHAALEEEQKKMDGLEKKKKRIELKYEIMLQKIGKK